MTWVVALAGWCCVLVLVVRLAAARESAARVSHEVRGPLTAAMLALHGLEGPTERLRGLAAQLERAARSLEDLTRPSGERVEPLAAAALMAGIAEAWRPVAAAQGRTISITPASAGLTVLADRHRIGQAVGNLIANALEHGSGTVEVRPRARGDALRIEVRDEGPGLPRSVAGRIRRPRAGRGERGRGLAIAATIAEHYGGRLSAAPTDRGAAMVLELPLVPPAEAARA